MAAAVFATVLTAGLRPAGAEGVEVALLPVPEPLLDLLELDARAQIVQLQDELENELAVWSRQGAVGPEEAEPRKLAKAYGRLGQAYYSSDFTEAAAAAWDNASRLAPGEFRWHYLLGVVRSRDGDLEGARSALGAAIAIRDDYVPAFVRLADADVDLGDAQRARENLERAIALNPESAAALKALGSLAVQERRYAEAIELLERALEAQPEATTIHHVLGMAHRGAGDLERARLHLSLNTQGRMALDDPVLDESGWLEPGARAFIRAGIEATRDGDIETARRAFEKAVVADPEDAVAWYNLAVARRDSAMAGAKEAAKTAFEEALVRDPGHRDAHWNLANLLVEQGDVGAAERHYRSVVGIDPLDKEARLEWCVALSRLGRVAEAEAELGRLVAGEPVFVQGRLGLAMLLSQTGRLAEARSVAAAGLDLDRTPEEEAEIHQLMAQLAQRAGDAGEAEARYRAALDLAPGLVPARQGLATLLARSGRFAAAAEEFGRLVEAAPEQQDLRTSQAMALLLGRQYPAAVSALDRALAGWPDAPGLLQIQARLLAAAPDPAVRDGVRALALAQRAMQLRASVDNAESVAMALAEQGRFEEAIDWQRRVVSERERLGQPGAARSRAFLAGYERGEPVREPWLQGQVGR